MLDGKVRTYQEHSDEGVGIIPCVGCRSPTGSQVRPTKEDAETEGSESPVRLVLDWHSWGSGTTCDIP